ncbi:MAG: hypothetical protein KDD84_01895, partial [Caldilineaceae bacterium]|nr:hypothetical protein [Caldilineaceae bacterium]
VCGQGIKVSDTGTDILDNTIVASKQDSEDAEKAAIITTGSTSGVTVRGNIVEDSPEHIYEFAGTQVPQALRTFKPARITGIDGVNISGASGEGSPCPNCIVDLYRDDADLLDEALEYLGSATADAQGNFTFTLSSPLQSGFGLRTMSTTQSLNVIPGLGSTTTTKNSVLYLPVSAVTVTLPTTGTVGMSVPVTLTVAPLAAGASLTYTIEATGIEDVTGAVGEDGTASTTLTWDGAGAKTVNVTVRNEFSSAVESTQITIVQGESKIFLPGVRR